MKELVSVIIPVYNIEQYVDECIYSIVNQSYPELEILIIDDGSTDSSGNRCDKWAKKDLRIKVIHQKNQGLSGARNVGINVCRGEWITFVDSDDVVSKDYVKILLELAKKYKTAISQCYFADICDMEETEENIEEGVLESVQFLLSEKYQTMAWGKIYKREVFEKERYPYGKIHEDVGVTYRVVYDAMRVSFTTQKLYFCHPERTDSINSSGRFYRERLVILQFLKEQILFYESKKEEKLIEKGYRDYAYMLLTDYSKTRKVLGDREIANKIKKEYQKICFYVVKRDENISLKTKILLILCFFCPELWTKLT